MSLEKEQDTPESNFASLDKTSCPKGFFNISNIVRYGVFLALLSSANCNAGRRTVTDSSSPPASGNVTDIDSDGDGILDGEYLPPSDFDNDGFPDHDDSCPEIYDYRDGNGRPEDSDADGIPDACDPYPDIPINIDSDGDGVWDQIDNCLGDFPINSIEIKMGSALRATMILTQV